MEIQRFVCNAKSVRCYARVWRFRIDLDIGAVRKELNFVLRCPRSAVHLLPSKTGLHFQASVLRNGRAPNSTQFSLHTRVHFSSHDRDVWGTIRNLVSSPDPPQSCDLIGLPENKTADDAQPRKRSPVPGPFPFFLGWGLGTRQPTKSANTSSPAKIISQQK